LKRHHSSDEDDILPSRKDIASLIFTNKTYAIFEGFGNMVNDDHTDVHEFVASVEYHTHFNPYEGEQVVDPLFPLFHAFIDYIRLLREDCYDFDLLAHDAIEVAIPYAYGDKMNMTLDFSMNFSILCDGTDGESMKRMCADVDITPRLMFDVSPNSVFDVVYELGDLWSESDELQSECSSHLNSTWWRMTERDPMESNESFVNSAWQSMPTHTVSMSMIMMMIGMAVMALLRSYGMRIREKKLMNTEEAAYGAI